MRRAAARVRRPETAPDNRDELMAALRANDEAVTEILRPALTAALPAAPPGSRWNDDEHGAGP
ncbi:hypothetical protein JCM9534A_04510 [Catenuloplanes indicus JCM 9534]